MVRINLRSCLLSIFLIAALCTATFGKIIYVDDDAAGANDGTNWDNAYVYLQDALADAKDGDEIRVAQGIYKPDVGGGYTYGNRRATFHLFNNVTLKGGYAGIGELDADVRDVKAYETILSGDLNGNDKGVANPADLWDESNRAENSYHVVTVRTTNETAVLNGFTITAGNANGPSLRELDYNSDRLGYGAGMCIISGSPNIINCTFIKNKAAWDGGGVYNEHGEPNLTDCYFVDNSAQNGGGIQSYYSSKLILNNCTFIENNAIFTGGGLNHWFRGLIMNKCQFSRNSAKHGGGMYNYSGYQTLLMNCIFSGNSAEYGGGIYNGPVPEFDPEFTNCIFSGNRADVGGGMYNRGDPTLTNCTFSGNYSRYGEGMANEKGSPTLANCIIWDAKGESSSGVGTRARGILKSELWNDEEGILKAGNSTIMITYSDVRYSWPGQGNICVEPYFVNLGYWADINDANMVVEPNDPNAVWIEGDYHLKSETGRWHPVSESWVVDDVASPCIDAGDPNSPVRDEPEPNGGIINMGAYGGTAEASMSPAGVETIVYVQWLGHASVKVWTDDCIVYVDPQNLSISPHDAMLVCVTHTHSDHYSPSSIARVSNEQTQFIGPPDVVQRYGSGQTIAPGQTMVFDFVSIKAVPAYNTNKSNHPKSNNWVGFIIELGGKRIYVAGDTDLIDEMQTLGDIDVAFLPAGGTYTMNATEAAEATGYIKPDLAIPYHWGQSVGTLNDAQRFAELAQCPAMVLAVGETISSDNWPEYSPLIAHWALDEAEGNIAHDSIGENHGTLSGQPAWQPAGGKIDGALQFDGIDDYISTGFVLNPADGAFSVFAWIKGGAPYQVIISQVDILAGRSVKPGSIWLCVDPLDGKLLTYLGLVGGGSPIPPLPPLVSESVITDGQWHHVGFVWDGSYRSLYVDGIEAASDTAAQNPLQSATSGLRIGAGGNLEAGNFFSGLIDDVRIYNQALSAEEIAALAK